MNTFNFNPKVNWRELKSELISLNNPTFFLGESENKPALICLKSPEEVAIKYVYTTHSSDPRTLLASSTVKRKINEIADKSGKCLVYIAYEEDVENQGLHELPKGLFSSEPYVRQAIAIKINVEALLSGAIVLQGSAGYPAKSIYPKTGI